MERRLVGVETFNDLVIEALLALIKRVERKQIDLAFKGMAEDTDYQKEAQLLTSDFETSDWEALLLAEMQGE